MLERRDLLGGSLAAGLAAAFGGSPPEQARPDATDTAAELKIAEAIDKLRVSIERHDEVPDVSLIRAQQRTFLKANQKFPEFIDVGIDVWERMHDWHVRNRQSWASTCGSGCTTGMYATASRSPSSAPTTAATAWRSASRRCS